MIDNDIIKALEHCIDGCNSLCPLHKNLDCRNRLCLNALDLINRQQAEIERLKIEKDNLIRTYAECQAEAVKEFAERLKASYRENKFAYDAECMCEEVDNLLKEMVGED